MTDSTPDRVPYPDNLANAIRRSEKWEIVSRKEKRALLAMVSGAAAHPGKPRSAPRYLPPAQATVRYMRREKSIGPDQIRKECATAHLNIARALYLQNMPYILTIGDVIWKGEPEWYTDLAYLREEALGARGPSDELRFHVWITLPDMTVLDAT